MAQFELNIYGNDDEVIKHFETDRVRWGIFMQALEVADKLEEKTTAEKFAVINQFVKMIFPSLTDEDLKNADIDDVLNTFKQLLAKAGRIGAGKNAVGAE